MAQRGKMLFKSPEEMQEKIDAYFEDCKGHYLTDENGDYVMDKFGRPILVDNKPLTVTGLALALGFTNRVSLLNYQGRAAYKETIERAKLRIENYAEMRLYDKDGSNGARFNLQNNFKDWNTEKAAQDGGKSPAINIICDIPRVEAVPQTGEADQAAIDALKTAAEGKPDG